MCTLDATYITIGIDSITNDITVDFGFLNTCIRGSTFRNQGVQLCMLRDTEGSLTEPIE